MSLRSEFSHLIPFNLHIAGVQRKLEVFISLLSMLRTNVYFVYY
jgi:hypothetical protein